MSVNQCVEAYQRHKNLKLAADELGIPWQTLYVNLRKAGVAVTGDKTRYGSDTDRLAAKAEGMFEVLVPGAVNHNREQWQPKVDFTVGTVAVDVKASRLTKANGKFKSMRWAFSVKKQELIADFFVCAAFDQEGENVIRWLVIPAELVRYIQTISLAANTPRGGSRWADYEVPAGDLAAFFDAVK